MSQSPTRRILAITSAAIVAIGLAACSGGSPAGGGGGDENAPEVAKVSMHTYPGALLSLPTFVAEEEGIFAKHSLEVEQLSFASGPEATQALVSGGVDVVDTSPSVINITNETFIESGSPVRIKAILGGVAGGLHYSIVGAPGVDWPDTDDLQAVLEALEDKTIGVTVVGADTQNVFIGLMETAGLDSTKANFVGVGIGASAVAAVTSGQVDALVSAPPAGELVVDQGGTMLVDFRKGGINDAFDPFMQTNYFATEKWLDENADVAERLQDAWVESMEFIADPANLDRVTEIYAGAGEGINVDQARSWVEAYIPLFTPNMSCAALKNINDFYITYTDTFKDPVSCDDYFWSGAADYVTD